MHIFLSWSGERSKHVAEALDEWLPLVLQEAEPFMSEHDIDLGARWANKLDEMMEETDFGVLCLTPENQDAPWLVHEAGAVGKSVDKSRVIPLLLDMEDSTVEWPLARFQNTELNRSGVRELLGEINSALEEGLSEKRLDKVFEKWWGELEAKLEDIPPRDRSSIDEGDSVGGQERRHEKLDEILELVRGMTRSGGVEHLSDRMDELESRVGSIYSAGIGELSVGGGHTSPGGVWTNTLEVFSPFDSLTKTAKLVRSLTKEPGIRNAPIDPDGIEGHALKVEYSSSDLSPEGVMELVDEHAKELGA